MDQVEEILEIFPLKTTKSQTLLTFVGVPARGAWGRVLFSYLERNGIKLLLVAEGPAGDGGRNLVLVIGEEAFEICRPDLDTLREAMEALSVEVSRPVAVVRILGPHFDIRPGIAGVLFGRLQREGIEVLASAVTITTSLIVVAEHQTELLVRTLGSLFHLPDRAKR